MAIINLITLTMKHFLLLLIQNYGENVEEMTVAVNPYPYLTPVRLSRRKSVDFSWSGFPWIHVTASASRNYDTDLLNCGTQFLDTHNLPCIPFLYINHQKHAAAKSPHL